MAELILDRLTPAPPVPQPNIFPLEWRAETPKLAAIWERAKVEGFNPSDLPWDRLNPKQWSYDERIALMYWWALLANFDASGPAVFSRAVVHSFETHQEDPLRKCLFSVARDEVNHEECSQRSIQGLVPGGPLNFTPESPLAEAAYNNIGWLYHNGGRYWRGFSESLSKYSLSIIFTSFMMGEVASSTLFHGMAAGSQHEVFSQAFKSIGRDEARHLQFCMTLLEKGMPSMPEAEKPLVTRQLRAGFVFLSMVLWEPPEQFWDLPDYFRHNHRILIDVARKAGLGVLTFDQQADNWRLAMARVAKLVGRWGIAFPAIPELDIAGVDVGNISAEDIIPVF